MELSNQEKINVVEKELSVFSEIVKYLTYFGVFTAFFGFISLLISWFYSKGFLTEFGFNSVIPNLYNSFERYPSIGIMYPAVLLSLLLLGYLFGKRFNMSVTLPKTLKHISFWIALLPALTVIIFYKQTSEASSIMFYIMYANPLFVVFGFSLNNIRSIVKNMFSPLYVYYPCFIIYLMMNLIYGSIIIGDRQANLIMESSIVSKPGIFLGNYPPFVRSVISKDSISSSIHPTLKYHKYIYESSDTTQIQLIIMDEHSYYFFEKTKYGNKSYSIAKDIISQIVFK